MENFLQRKTLDKKFYYWNLQIFSEKQEKHFRPINIFGPRGGADLAVPGLIF